MIARIVVVCFALMSGFAFAAAQKAAPKAPAMEKFSCRTGPNDHQARLVAQVVKGRPMEFAYYSRLGTKVCSVHGKRGDAYTKWEDHENKARVKLIEGTAIIEYEPGILKITFVDVGRMPYCGMYGELNGSVQTSAKKTECALAGVFD